ncbi:MAG: class I SAM-dependent methyltransferase [Nanoarchaeota archaeon]
MQYFKPHRKYPGRHWENHPTAYSEHFAKFLKSKKFHEKLVDVGCSSGRDVNVFNNFGFDAMGVDYAEGEISIAREKFPGLKFEVQNAESLKFADNSVGAFFMINVIHFTKKEKAIAEIFRALKHGGYFLIHFNIEIKDNKGKIDYYHAPKDILKLVSMFNIVHKKIFQRTDLKPIKHKHRIMELILQK